MTDTNPDLKTSARLALKLADVQLLQRARSGQPLSSADRKRAEELAAGGAAETAQATTAAEELAAAIRDRREKGKSIPKHLAQAAREEWLTRQATHIWPDIAAASKELGVSGQTVRNWLGEAGISHQRTALSKAELYRWLWQRERTRRQARSSDVDERIKEVRLARLEGNYETEALAIIDQAKGKLQDQLRDGFLARGPTDLVDLVRRHLKGGQGAAEDAVETWFRHHIQAIAGGDLTHA